MNPIDRFRKAFLAALRNDSNADAFCLCTSGENGAPDGRMLLLKRITSGGIVFYTDSRSPKLRQIGIRGRAAAVFWWPKEKVQVRMRGLVWCIPQNESRAYWDTRPLFSRVVTWASTQSGKLTLRAVARAIRDTAFGFPWKRTPYWWIGCELRPQSIEFFWLGVGRANQRVKFTRGSPQSDQWSSERLMP